MNVEEADPAMAVRMWGSGPAASTWGRATGYPGSGVVNFPAIFDALVENGYDHYITFESFSSEVVDRDLSITCAIWRNPWTDNDSVKRSGASSSRGLARCGARRRPPSWPEQHRRSASAEPPGP